MSGLRDSTVAKRRRNVNKKDALEKPSVILQEKEKAEKKKLVNSVLKEHTQIVRGNQSC